MKSLVLSLVVFLSIPVWAAQPNMCERILNDYLKNLGLGKSYTEFSAADFKTSSQPLAEAMVDYKNLTDRMATKRSLADRLRQDISAQYEELKKVDLVPPGKKMMPALVILDLFSDEINKKNSGIKWSYIYDEKGPVAEAYAKVTSANSSFYQQCSNQKVLGTACQAARVDLEKKKADLLKKLGGISKDSDKIIKTIESREQPIVTKIKDLERQTSQLDADIRGYKSTQIQMEMQNPNFARWAESVNDQGGTYDGLKLTTVTTKFANNYDKSRIAILEERRQVLLAKQDDAKIDFKQINDELQDIKNELSLLKESPVLQVLSKNGEIKSFSLGPPVEIKMNSNCEEIEITDKPIKPEILAKSPMMQKFVFAAKGVKSIEEYANIYESHQFSGPVKKYQDWVLEQKKALAPRRSSGRVTTETVDGKPITPQPAGR